MTPTFPYVQVAIGLRNPFFFSVDRGDAVGTGRGDVFIGDVGQMFSGSVFRFDPATGGLPNFGWPWRIGDGAVPWNLQVATAPGPCIASEPTNPTPTYQDPFLVFSDESVFGSPDRSALVGGYAYRGTVGALQNRYFFASYNGGAGSGGPRLFHVDVAYAGQPAVPTSVTVGWPSPYTIQGMGQDSDGELYVIRVNEGVNPGSGGNGEIYKIQ